MKTIGNMSPDQSFNIHRVYRHHPHVRASFTRARKKVRLLDGKITWSIFSSFVGDMERLLEGGVKFSILTEIATKQQKMPEYMEALEKHPLFEMRLLPTLLPTNLLLFDEREVAIWSKPQLLTVRKPRKVQALWSTHHGLFKLTSNYFEILWNKASSLN